MQINIDQVVKDLYGNPVKEKADGKDVEVRLGEILTLAFTRGEDPKEQVNAHELVRRKRLAQMMIGHGEVSLKADDIALLKKLISNLVKNIGFNAVLAGIVIEMIDPTEGG